MRISDWSSDVCSSDLVQHLDALEYLAHDWRPGWIGKAVLDVPLGQSGQALLERIGSEPTGMVGQIVGDAVRCRRQVAAPFDLEVAHRGLVAAPGVLAGGGIKVAVEGRHAPFGSFSLAFLPPSQAATHPTPPS